MLGKIKIISPIYGQKLSVARKVVNTENMSAGDRGKLESALLLSTEVAGDGDGFWLLGKTCVVIAGAVVETRGETGTSIVGEVEGSTVDLIQLADVTLLVVKDSDIGALAPNPVPKKLGICLVGQEYQVMTYFILIKVKDSIHILEKYVSNQPPIWSKGVFSDDVARAQITS